VKPESRSPVFPGRDKKRILPSIALLAFLALLSSCGQAGGFPPAILDSAFAAIHPGLAGAIGKASKPLFAEGKCEILGLEEGTTGLLAAARRMGFQPDKAGRDRLVTSPLFALAFLEGERGIMTGENKAGIDALGGALLVVPEWQGIVPAELVAVRSDFNPAFEAAGRGAGKFIADLSGETAKTGGSPEAAILFRATSARGREALEAFSAACEKASGRPPLVREIGAGAEEGEIEAAAKDLLSSDIRIILVALGEDEKLALGLLSRPGIALVAPDDAALARALGEKAARAKGGDCIQVPARLEPKPPARELRAAGKSLAEIIGERS
jgi:hypothetical protein